ncbi:MAG TPA: VWA domain-containing protein [Mycobacteriales bacterium]|nr:VWA domain-containing protein [Mycobacteriales bacterium]
MSARADPPGEVDAVRLVVALGRALQSAGIAAGPDRVAEAVRAVAALDPLDRDDVYWAGRLTLCSGRDDLDRYDAVFAALFAGDVPRLRPRSRDLVRGMPVALAGTEDADGGAGGDGEERAILRAAASTVETLRHKDVTTLSPGEQAALRRALAALSLPGEPRPFRRWQPTPHAGDVDPRRTVRALLRSGGEPVRLRHRRHGVRPRRVVVLVDVSGSMSGYADALLRFAHAAARRRGTHTEVFTLGTRLTRITRELGTPDPDSAMAAVSAAVPDWSGGTRLGVLLREFLDRWGQRGAARGAVVVLLSDGWERDDPALLGAQMRRLALLAHRVVWCNPRKARPGFAPLAGGLAAALPHVDDFVDGHSLAALQRLAEVVVGGRGPVTGSRVRTREAVAVHA